MRHGVLVACAAGMMLATQRLAPAQQDPVVGRYIGQGEGDLNATVRRLPQGRYRIDITTTDAGRCAGGVDGEAMLTDGRGTLRTENQEYDPNAPDSPLSRDRYCSIAVSMGSGSMRTEEGDGCLGFHGAACGFTGTLRRR